MSNIVEVTIKVDLHTGVTLEHTCAKCGVTARSKPVSYDSYDRETGRQHGEVFRVSSAEPPEGWEHIRFDGRHVKVCLDCLRKFLGGT
jgi:hypothetical protein